MPLRSSPCVAFGERFSKWQRRSTVIWPSSKRRIAKPGHRRDRSAQSYRYGSVMVLLSLLMVNLVGEHRPKDRVAQMVVRSVASQVSVQVLDGVIDMLFGRNLLVVAVILCLPVLPRAVLCDGCRGEHRIGRQEVEGVGRR